MTTTDTPRTDACPHCGEEARINQNDTYYCGSWRISTGGVSRTDQCRALERAEKAEAERDEARKALRLNLQTTGGLPWREWREECVKETLRADENLERAERAEAEVERLNANLLRAVEIAVNLSWDYADTEYDAELDQLKATLNPDNK